MLLPLSYDCRNGVEAGTMAQLLLNDNCTVTMVHSKTRNIEDVVKTADIVIAAVGRAETVKASWIKQGACIIDVGINRIASKDGKSRIIGDVDFDAPRMAFGHPGRG